MTRNSSGPKNANPNAKRFVLTKREEWQGFLNNIRSRIGEDAALLKDCEDTGDMIWGIPCQPGLFESIAISSREYQECQS